MGMTNEEAIKELRDASDSEVRYGDTEHHYNEVMKRVEAFEMAIKALEQQQNVHDKCKRCVEFSEFEQQSCEDWLSTFNTDSATECFTAVQRLKEGLNADSD